MNLNRYPVLADEAREKIKALAVASVATVEFGSGNRKYGGDALSLQISRVIDAF